MHCNKCGKNIPEDSKFCPNCGADLNKQKTRNASNMQNKSAKMETPLQILLHYIKKHKKISIGIAISIFAIIIGAIVTKRIIQEQKLKDEVEIVAKHLTEIVGTYKSSSKYNNITLVLNIDGTATLTTSGYNESTHLGYWREKGEGCPIEIEFSNSFEITIGSKEIYYCDSLYFDGNALWQSMDAIRSNDLSCCEYMIKQKTKDT